MDVELTPPSTNVCAGLLRLLKQEPAEASAKLAGSSSMTSPIARPRCFGQPVLLECFCRKQSAFLRVWRKRWLVLTPEALMSFRSKRGYLRGDRPTERFALATLGTTRAVDQVAVDQGQIFLEGSGRPLARDGEVGRLLQAAWLVLAAAERPLLLDFALPDSPLPGEELRWLRNAWGTEVVNAKLLLQTGNRAYAAPGLHVFEPRAVRFEERYCAGRVIGRGAFSTVHAATCLQSGREVAVKRVAKLRLSPAETQRLQSEMEILRRCRHPHVVALLNHFETPATVHLVMELLPGGDIFEQVIRRFRGEERGYTEGDVAEIVRMALSAVAHLHALSIVHRDIKPENVLLCTGGRHAELKLADFGCAQMLRPGETCAERVGTPGYMAPELLRGATYAFAVDVWSLGVLVFMLLSGTAPFDFGDPLEEERQVCAGVWSFAHRNWGAVSDAAKGVVSRMLCVEPARRASAAELLKCDWALQRVSRAGAGAAMVRRGSLGAHEVVASAGHEVVASAGGGGGGDDGHSGGSGGGSSKPRRRSVTSSTASLAASIETLGSQPRRKHLSSRHTRSYRSGEHGGGEAGGGMKRSISENVALNVAMR